MTSSYSCQFLPLLEGNSSIGNQCQKRIPHFRSIKWWNPDLKWGIEKNVLLKVSNSNQSSSLTDGNQHFLMMIDNCYQSIIIDSYLSQLLSIIVACCILHTHWTNNLTPVTCSSLLTPFQEPFSKNLEKNWCSIILYFS